MKNWYVGYRDVDGNARVEVFAAVFGERCICWWQDDGAVYFVAGRHFTLKLCSVLRCFG